MMDLNSGQSSIRLSIPFQGKLLAFGSRSSPKRESSVRLQSEQPRPRGGNVMIDIQYGERFAWNGSSWAFDHAEDNSGLLWFARDDGKMDSISELDLMIGFQRGTHHYDRSYKGGRYKKTETLLLHLNSFSEKHISLAYARRRYVTAIIAAGTPKRAAKTWSAIIHALELSAPIECHPSWHTVKKWVELFEASGGDIRSLIPGFRKRGRKNFFATMSQGQKNFIGKIMGRYNEKFLPTLNTIYKDLEVEHEEQRRKNPLAASWKTPSKGTVRRWLEKADRLTLLERRVGKEEAKRQLKLQQPGYEALDRLDVVEIDHTEADIIVIDENGCVLGRPTLTIAIDAYTRMIVGHYIGFEPPSVYSVMMCLRDILQPKTYLQTEYNLKVEWKAFGRPVVVLVDNAAEFKSGSFKAVTGLLNIDIRIQPVGKPWFKGRVESFMNKISHSRAVRTHGATLNITHRRKAGYDPQKEARIGLQEFRVAFLEWMLLEHAYEFHEEIMDVPARRWEEAVALRPVRLCSADELDEVLGHHETATLTNKGLRYEYLFYQCPELQDLHFASGSLQLGFVSNPGNMGSIMVTLPSGHTVRAHCTYHDYASKVSLWQHRRIRAEARKNGNEWISEQNLHDALVDMVRRSAEYMQRGKASKKAVRDLGLDYVSQPGQQSENPTLMPVTDLNWAVKHGNVNDAEPNRDSTPISTNEVEDDVPTTKVRVNSGATR
jgi:putative transposase